MSGGPAVPAEDDADTLIGRTLAGKYVIEGLIGSGAMGSVYRAHQSALDKTVALKVLHREHTLDRRFVERFEREARAASRLDHPNSVRVLDFGEDAGFLYIVMEYVRGKDLFCLFDEQRPFPAERVVEILCQALAALAVAHDMGVLHRDLKPENLMVLDGTSDDGQDVDQVKVCDFGIAKLIEPTVVTAEGRSPRAPALGSRKTRRLTTPGLVVGTPEYMSPEQARGGRVDARSDLYSVGVILYEALTGRLPFHGDSPVAVAAKHLHEEPVAPSSIAIDVDPRLEAICLKAMSKDPEARYGSAREMRAALRETLGNVTPSVAPASGSRTAPTVLTRLGRHTVDTVPARRSRRTWRGPRVLGVLTGLVGGAAVLLLGVLRHKTVVLDTEAPRAATESSTTAQVDPTTTSPSVVPSAPERGPSPGPTAVETASPTRPSRGGRLHHGAAEAKRSAHEPLAPEVTIGAPSEPASAGTAITPPAQSAPPASLPPLPPAAPPAAPPRAFNLATARVDVGSATNLFGTTSLGVNKALAGIGEKLTACYRAVLPQVAAPASGPGTLHIETDEDGIVVTARVDASPAPAAAPCMVAAARGRKIANVDTGRASADVQLVFRPE